MLKVLGIETSCDETSVAIVTQDKKILFNHVISQVQEHSIYKGVVPEIASRSHLNYLDYLLHKAKDHLNTKVASGSELREATKQIAPEVDFSTIDAIAVTSGPGLIGGLMVGVMYAKAIATVLNKPIIAVNHLEGHALTARLTDSVEFPYLLLLASGGHTQFLIVRGAGDYTYLGGTLDDAMGECFDKVAKLLNLGYPGAPELEKRSYLGNSKRFRFPKPLCDRIGCDFSFSGLKTAVKNVCNGLDLSDQNNVNDVAASFQTTVGQVLKTKLEYALKNNDLKLFVMAGGVAANMYLRGVSEEVCAAHGVRFVVPPIKLCGDNAAMIAWAGIERLQKGLIDNIDFKPRSRWELAQ